MMDAGWKLRSKEKQKQFKRFLEKVNQKNLIRQLPELHDEAFSKIDCLACANCCKNHSPTFKTTDIKRISRYLRLRESDFIETFLKVDEDNDYVLRQTPCAFLNADNTCQIYDARPGDCARYPYTDSDVLVKRKQLTLANSMVCPAVFSILEKISAID